MQQQGIEVFYDGVNVGDYEADLIVEGRVIVEVKAVTALDDAHIAQCLNYMKATRLETCLLVNFGKAEDPGAAIGYDQGGLLPGRWSWRSRTSSNLPPACPSVELAGDGRGMHGDGKG